MKKKKAAPVAPERGSGRRPFGPAPDVVKQKKGCASLRAAQRSLELRARIVNNGLQGMTQSQMAAAAGVGLDTVRRFERCQGQIGVDNLERIAGALGVHVSDLVAPWPAARA